jgi:pimeloyl-ACP methyl ester carboxylesterase
MLLVHPMGFHGGVMCALARNLDSVHCYAPDLRGHGHTRAPENYDFPPSGAAHDILACADGVERQAGVGLIGMGHSLGAAALVLAEAERPGTFERLYLYEPAIIPPDGRTKIDSDSPYIQRTLRRRRAFGSLQAAYTNFSSKPPMQDFTADAFVAYIRDGFAVQADGSVLMRCLPEIEAAISMSGISFRAFERLGAVGCPVVVGRSTLPDSPGRAPYETDVVRALADARLENVGPLTHFGPQQQPARVAVHIQSWIAGDVSPSDA